jgi:hypothetical protein
MLTPSGVSPADICSPGFVVQTLRGVLSLPAEDDGFAAADRSLKNVQACEISESWGW